MERREASGEGAGAATDAAQADPEATVQAIAGDAAEMLERRMRALVEVEGRLTAMMDRIAAAAELARSANERAIVVEHRVLGIERELTG
jgi:hypothetical protein